MRSKKQVMLSPEEEENLFRAIKEKGCTKSRDKLSAHYRPLAVSRALDFSRRTGMPVEDLVQEAMVALIVSIDKFELGRNARLSTFAGFHIHSALVRYLMDNAGPTRVGTNVKDKKIFSNLRRMVAAYEIRVGHQIDDEGYAEIAETLGVPVDAIIRMENRVFSRDVSIDACAQDDEGSSQSWVEGEIGEEGYAGDVEVSMDHRRIMQEIRKILPEIVQDRNLDILERRIAGFDGPDEYRALGERHGISGERVRQIQRHGLKKIREHLKARGYSGMEDISIKSA